MARQRVLTSFVATLGVLALLVGLSLQRTGAQTETPKDDTTLVAYLPVVSLGNAEVATVHVTNVGRDVNSPAEKFSVMFADARGVLLVPEQICDLRMGETCSVSLMSGSCPPSGDSRVCEFRAIVVGEELPCVTPDMGTGEWLADIELLVANRMLPTRISKYVAGANRVMKLPVAACSPPDAPPPDAPPPPLPDAPPPDAPLPDAMPPDAPPADAMPPDAPLPDFATPPDAPPGPDNPPPPAAALVPNQSSPNVFVRLPDRARPAVQASQSARTGTR